MAAPVARWHLVDGWRFLTFVRNDTVMMYIFGCEVPGFTLKKGYIFLRLNCSDFLVAEQWAPCRESDWSMIGGRYAVSVRARYGASKFADQARAAGIIALALCFCYWLVVATQMWLGVTEYGPDRTPLIEAIINNHPKVANILVSHGANQERQFRCGEDDGPPLAWALRYGRKDIARYCSKPNSNPYFRNNLRRAAGRVWSATHGD